MIMHSATILAIAGTTAAAVQTFGHSQAAGAIMLMGNLLVIGLAGWRRWRQSPSDSVSGGPST